MVNSIQQFQTNGTKELTKIFNAYVEDPTKVAEMVYGVTDVVIGLGLSLIGEEWESYDELLWKRKDLRPDWSVIRRDEGKKITSLGEVHYRKTYFINKKTREMLSCRQTAGI